MTILWQTDEVRSRRPRVVDEIRHGLWFVERSLWQALPRLVRELQDAIPGAPPPLRLGTWIGGDMDGNPNAGAETIARRARARADARARPPARRRCASSAPRGAMSTELVGPGPGARRPTSDEPYRDALVRIWERLAADEYRDAEELAGDLARIDATLARPRRRPGRRRRARRSPRARRGVRPARGDARRARPREGGAGAGRARRRRLRGRRGGARAPRAALARARDRVDDRERERRARGRGARARGRPGRPRRAAARDDRRPARRARRRRASSSTRARGRGSR